MSFFWCCGLLEQPCFLYLAPSCDTSLRRHWPHSCCTASVALSTLLSKQMAERKVLEQIVEWIVFMQQNCNSSVQPHLTSQLLRQHACHSG